MSRRSGSGEAKYDLVCGQGRLEAYQTLGQSNVPALVVAADREDCLIASLVENCARRHNSALDMLQDIGRMVKEGHTRKEIARKTGLSLDYVKGVAQLLERGEHRLLRSVESGIVPITVAVEIAEAQDADIQNALTAAYESGQLKGKKLLAAKRLVEIRRRRGKGTHSSRSASARNMTADALVKAYQEDAERKKAMIRRNEITRGRLLFLTEALRTLSLDERYLCLVEDESLADIPAVIAHSISSNVET